MLTSVGIPHRLDLREVVRRLLEVLNLGNNRCLRSLGGEINDVSVLRARRLENDAQIFQVDSCGVLETSNRQLVMADVIISLAGVVNQLKFVSFTIKRQAQRINFCILM